MRRFDATGRETLRARDFRRREWILHGIAVAFCASGCARFWGLEDLRNSGGDRDSGTLGETGLTGAGGALIVDSSAGGIFTGSDGTDGAGGTSSIDPDLGSGGMRGVPRAVDASDTDVLDGSRTGRSTDDGGNFVADGPVAVENANDGAGEDGEGDAGRAVMGTIVFSDDFENDALGSAPDNIGWHRFGGSMTDWAVASDGTHVLRQVATSATFRICYGGPSTGGPSTVAAQVKVNAGSTIGASRAALCLRYDVVTHGYDCLALVPGLGAQLIFSGETGPLWNGVPIVVGVWYDVRLSIDASGLLTGYVNDTALGTFRPATSPTNGFAAFATASVMAEFDDVVLTVP